VDAQRLEAMQLVARMKESADKFGIGFVGGFIAPDGQKFMMTNLSPEDTELLTPKELTD
jgi:selenophosphate synthetase-related protein